MLICKDANTELRRSLIWIVDLSFFVIYDEKRDTPAH